jgi:DNA-binding MarR family transcriptional regulator
MKSNPFYSLWLLSIFQRKHLHMLQTLVDYSLVIEVGFHQKNGNPLTLKQLFLLDLAAPSTVQRRLNRLIRLGMIDKEVNPADRRMVEMKISPSADRLLARYTRLIEQAEANGESSSAEKVITIPPLRKGRPAAMLNLISMRPEERACGTCAHWEGARAFQSGTFRFVDDSDGTCRVLASKEHSFLKTLKPSTERDECENWQSVERA